MQEEAEKFRAEDEAHVLRVNKRNEIEQDMYDVKNFLREDEERGRFSEDDAEIFAEIYKKGMEYLDSHPRANFKELEAAQMKAMERLAPLIRKYNLHNSMRRGQGRGHHEDYDSEDDQ